MCSEFKPNKKRKPLTECSVFFVHCQEFKNVMYIPYGKKFTMFLFCIADLVYDLNSVNIISKFRTTK